MSKRKTVSIKDLVTKANAMLEATPDDWVGERHGIAALLSWALHETGQYAGFNYQQCEFLPVDEQTDGNVLIPGYDDSRRRYYLREV